MPTSTMPMCPCFCLWPAGGSKNICWRQTACPPPKRAHPCPPAASLGSRSPWGRFLQARSINVLVHLCLNQESDLNYRSAFDMMCQKWLMYKRSFNGQYSWKKRPLKKYTKKMLSKNKFYLFFHTYIFNSFLSVAPQCANSTRECQIWDSKTQNLMHCLPFLRYNETILFLISYR